MSLSPVMTSLPATCSFFFFNDTATTEIYTLSLHDALPISSPSISWRPNRCGGFPCSTTRRSEEHTSELQSRENLVCRLLLEKKKLRILHPFLLSFIDRSSPNQTQINGE